MSVTIPRAMTGSTKSGAPLMGDAFAFQRDDPPIDVAIHDGQSGKDEREGFRAGLMAQES